MERVKHGLSRREVLGIMVVSPCCTFSVAAAYKSAVRPETLLFLRKSVVEREAVAHAVASAVELQFAQGGTGAATGAAAATHSTTAGTR